MAVTTYFVTQLTRTVFVWLLETASERSVSEKKKNGDIPQISVEDQKAKWFDAVALSTLHWVMLN